MQAGDGVKRLAGARPTTAQEKASLQREIQGMDVRERIELATLGNEEVRSILIRDPAGEVRAAVLNNPQITHGEIQRIASSSTVDEEVIRLIVQNRQWISKHEILVALVANPKTPVKVSLRFLRLLGEDHLTQVARSVKAPSEVTLAAKRALAERMGQDAARQATAQAPAGEDAIHQLAEAQPLTEQERANLFLQIQRMGVGERIRLAMLGNKEVRSILIRDSTRAVQVAVINNPRITDTEVERIAASKTVEDEVLRLIINNRNWVKNYAVKLALVRNPKTPIKTSLRFLSFLRDKDLKDTARSKEIPNTVVVGAKKILYERRR